MKVTVEIDMDERKAAVCLGYVGDVDPQSLLEGLLDRYVSQNLYYDSGASYTNPDRCIASIKVTDVN